MYATRHGFIASLRVVGERGVFKARTPTTMGVAHQRELGHDQEFALSLRDGPIHFAGLVGKNADPRDLVGHVGNVRVGIAFRHPQEHHEPLGNGCDGLALDRDGR